MVQQEQGALLTLTGVESFQSDLYCLRYTPRSALVKALSPDSGNRAGRSAGAQKRDLSTMQYRVARAGQLGESAQKLYSQCLMLAPEALFQALDRAAVILAAYKGLAGYNYYKDAAERPKFSKCADKNTDLTLSWSGLCRQATYAVYLSYAYHHRDVCFGEDAFRRYLVPGLLSLSGLGERLDHVGTQEGERGVVRQYYVAPLLGRDLQFTIQTAQNGPVGGNRVIVTQYRDEAGPYIIYDGDVRGQLLYDTMLPMLDERAGAFIEANDRALRAALLEQTAPSAPKSRKDLVRQYCARLPRTPAEKKAEPS